MTYCAVWSLILIWQPKSTRAERAFCCSLCLLSADKLSNNDISAQVPDRDQLLLVGKRSLMVHMNLFLDALVKKTIYCPNRILHSIWHAIYYKLTINYFKIISLPYINNIWQGCDDLNQVI